MDFSLINIGFGNMASTSRIIAIISPESAPVKRMIQEARDKGSLIDATFGYGQQPNYFICSSTGNDFS